MSDLPAIERFELLAEVERLRVSGRLNRRTVRRIGALIVALGSPALRPVALMVWAGCDADILAAGAQLWPEIERIAASAGVSPLDVAEGAVRVLIAPPAAPEPATPPEPLEELLPAGFTISGRSLAEHTRLAVALRDPDAIAERPLWAAAIEAHRAGDLAGFVARTPGASLGG